MFHVRSMSGENGGTMSQITVKGRNRTKLLIHLASLSNHDLAKLVSVGEMCDNCPFYIDCREQEYYVTCQNLMEMMLDKDEYLQELENEN